MPHLTVRSLILPAVAVAAALSVLAACYDSPTGAAAGPNTTNSPSPAATTDASITSQARSAAERGEALVRAKACAGCHQGTAADAPQLGGRDETVGHGAFAPNLTPDKDTGIGDWTDEEIVRAIREGKDDEEATLCSVMPRFADLSYAQALDIVAYLRGLPPVNHQAPESQCDDPDQGDPDGGDEAGDDGGDEAGDDAGNDARDDDSGDKRDAGNHDGGLCQGAAPPDMTAPCNGCGTHACQANGCYGGYWCEVVIKKCAPKPAGCP